jgi:hypothetical protein
MHLPKGIHVATLEEIEERFVRDAPFPERRKIVFNAFRLWHEVVSGMLPGAKYWVNGGFVTHKSWAAPNDVDVVVLVKTEDLKALSLDQERAIELLMTKPGTPRVQPMSGMVDAFICVRGNVERTLHWREFWSTLADENKKPIEGVQKGFLEVRP